MRSACLAPRGVCAGALVAALIGCAATDPDAARGPGAGLAADGPGGPDGRGSMVAPANGTASRPSGGSSVSGVDDASDGSAAARERDVFERDLAGALAVLRERGAGAGAGAGAGGGGAGGADASAVDPTLDRGPASTTMRSPFDADVDVDDMAWPADLADVSEADRQAVRGVRRTLHGRAREAGTLDAALIGIADVLRETEPSVRALVGELERRWLRAASGGEARPMSADDARGANASPTVAGRPLWLDDPGAGARRLPRPGTDGPGAPAGVATLRDLVLPSAERPPVALRGPQPHSALTTEARIRAERQYVRGKGERLDGRLLAAVSSLRTAAGIDPTAAPILRELALTWEALGNREQATETWQRLLDVRPEDPRALLAVAGAALDRDQPRVVLAFVARSVLRRLDPSWSPPDAPSDAWRPPAPRTDTERMYAPLIDILALEAARRLGEDRAVLHLAARLVQDPWFDRAADAAFQSRVIGDPSSIERAGGDAALRLGEGEAAALFYRGAIARRAAAAGGAADAASASHWSDIVPPTTELRARIVAVRLAQGRPMAARRDLADEAERGGHAAVAALGVARWMITEGAAAGDRREPNGHDIALLAAVLAAHPDPAGGQLDGLRWRALERAVPGSSLAAAAAVLPPVPTTTRPAAAPRALALVTKPFATGPAWPDPLVALTSVADRLLDARPIPLTAAEAGLRIDATRDLADAIVPVALDAARLPDDGRAAAVLAAMIQRTGHLGLAHRVAVHGVERDPDDPWCHLLRLRLAAILQDRAGVVAAARDAEQAGMLPTAVVDAVADGLGGDRGRGRDRRRAGADAAADDPRDELRRLALFNHAPQALRVPAMVLVAEACARFERPNLAEAVAAQAVPEQTRREREDAWALAQAERRGGAGAGARAGVDADAGAGASDGVAGLAWRDFATIAHASAIAEQAARAGDERERFDIARGAVALLEPLTAVQPEADTAWLVMLSIVDANGPVRDARSQRAMATRWRQVAPDRAVRQAAERRTRRRAGDGTAVRLAAWQHLVEPDDDAALEDLVEGLRSAGRSEDAAAVLDRRRRDAPADPFAAELQVREALTSGATDGIDLILEARRAARPDDLVATRLAELTARARRDHRAAARLAAARLAPSPDGPNRSLEFAIVAARAGDAAARQAGLDRFTAQLAIAGPRQIATAVTAHRDALATGDASAAASAAAFAERLAATRDVLDESMVGIGVEGLARIARVGAAEPTGASGDPAPATERFDALVVALATRGRVATTRGVDAVLPWRDLAQRLVDAGRPEAAARAVRIAYHERRRESAARFADPAPDDAESAAFDAVMFATMVTAADAADAATTETLRVLQEVAAANFVAAYAQTPVAAADGAPTATVYAEALVRASHIHRLAGASDTADALLRRAVAVDPTHATALNDDGYARIDRADAADPLAARMIEAAAALDPESASIIDSLGWLRYRQGRLTAADGAALAPADPGPAADPDRAAGPAADPAADPGPAADPDPAARTDEPRGAVGWPEILDLDLALPTDADLLPTIPRLALPAELAGLGAVELLERAVAASAADPSAEGLSHLGDALWRVGRRDEAFARWREGAAIMTDPRHRTNTVQALRQLQLRSWGLVVRDPADMYDEQFAPVLRGLLRRIEATVAGEDPPIAPTFAGAPLGRPSP